MFLATMTVATEAVFRRPWSPQVKREVENALRSEEVRRPTRNQFPQAATEGKHRNEERPRVPVRSGAGSAYEAGRECCDEDQPNRWVRRLTAGLMLGPSVVIYCRRVRKFEQCDIVPIPTPSAQRGSELYGT